MPLSGGYYYPGLYNIKAPSSGSIDTSGSSAPKKAATRK